ncbi:MAG: hypothetical protein PVH61_04015 [Candidatus Aminicenantes bacterium]
MRNMTITGQRNSKYLLWLPLLLILLFSGTSQGKQAKSTITSNISGETIRRVIGNLLQTHGNDHQFRIQRGVTQAASFWRESDGSETDFENFCKKHFISDPVQLSKTLERIETNFETLWGFFLRISRDLDRPFFVEKTKDGQPITILPLDHLFTRYSPRAHLDEDLFKTKAAFAIIMNFPQYPLEEKLEEGRSWSREQWAAAAAGDIFASRVPPEVNQKYVGIVTNLFDYHDRYFIYLGKLLTDQNKTLFPPDLKSFVHWMIREELRAGYTDPQGPEKQEIIYRVMLRVVDQSIPKIVIDNPKVYWNPVSNQVYQKKGNRFLKIKSEPEGGIRYKYWQSAFKAEQLLDPYYPNAPTLIQRTSGTVRKIPGKVVEDLLISVMKSPLTKKVGRLIEKRLGRSLRPYDIWYNGFKFGQTRELPQEKLDKTIKDKYPSAAAFKKNIPVFLEKFGFSPGKAAFIAERIEVEPSRQVGHGMAALMRSDKAYLRAEFPSAGMNYSRFFLALHEMGHTIEQVCSMHMIDHYLLHGVPTSAISENFAYMFGNRALEFLGMEKYKINDPLKTLDAFWLTYKTSGVALVDMKAWEWMYQHPQASASQFQGAVIRIAKEIWNQYYAPVFKEKDVPILLIYSHLLGGMLYFPDYPIGQILGFQLETYMEEKNHGVEMERMCKIGNLPPGIWMQQAVGAPISTAPLLKATEKVLNSVNTRQ